MQATAKVFTTKLTCQLVVKLSVHKVGGGVAVRVASPERLGLGVSPAGPLAAKEALHVAPRVATERKRSLYTTPVSGDATGDLVLTGSKSANRKCAFWTPEQWLETARGVKPEIRRPLF